MSSKLDVKHPRVTGSEFEDLNMSGSRFTGINLSNATFHDINFSDVSFTAAQIGGALFKHIGPPPDKDRKSLGLIQLDGTNIGYVNIIVTITPPSFLGRTNPICPPIGVESSISWSTWWWHGKSRGTYPVRRRSEKE